MHQKHITDRSSKITFAFRFLGIGLLLWLCIHFDFRQVVQQCLILDGKVIVQVFFINVGVVLFKFFRWHWIVKTQTPQLQFWTSFRIYQRGLFWGMISPGRIGELTKCYDLHKETGISYISTAVLVLYDRLYDIQVLIFFFAVGWLMAAKVSWSEIVCIGCILIFLFGGMKYILPKLLPKLEAYYISLFHEQEKKINTKTDNFPSTISIPPVALTTCSLFTMALAGYLLSIKGYYIDFSFVQVLFITTLLSLSSILPVSVLGLGTNEAVLLLATKIYFPILYNPEKIIAFSISVSILAFLSGLMISSATLFFATSRLRKDKATHSKREPKNL